MRTLFRLLVAATVVACASMGASGGGGDRNVLTAQEIAARTDILTAYDAVRQLRPWFVNQRGLVGIPKGQSDTKAQSDTTAANASQVKVFLGLRLLGAVDQLNQIPVSAVVEIRFY